MLGRKFCFRLSKQIYVLQACTRLPLSLDYHYHTETNIYGNTACKSHFREESVDLPTNDGVDRCGLLRFVEAYREHGHKKATLDPLGLQGDRFVPELSPRLYGLSLDDNVTHSTEGLVNIGVSSVTTSDLIQQLEHIYCGTLSAQFQQLSTREERRWFADRFERLHREEVSDNEKIAMATLMLKAQAFDHFLASKFGTVKRYGGEGAESAFTFYQRLFQLAAAQDVHDVVVSIAHRGRLNLLTCVLQLEPVIMFRKMKGKSEFPPSVAACGDVLSHLTASVDLQFGADSVHVTMLPNPSHLEVSLGRTASM